MFSEKTTPISELVKGNPDRPTREPALVILTCLFNVFQVYQLVQIINQAPTYDPYFSWYLMMLVSTISVLVIWYVIFSVILLIGAGIIYFINRRAGGALILVMSIIGFIIGFVGMGISLMFAYSIFFVVTTFLAPFFSLLAGIWGVRSEKPPTTADMQEII
ncbi:MAG: hypothetical protein ACFFAL_07325 [Promethearchaeota archaeon]